MEIDGASSWAQLAQDHWKGEGRDSQRVRAEVVKGKIWDSLERDGFRSRDITELEQLQLLELYLWPGYSEAASNHHVLLLAILATVKRREGLPVWDIFQSNASGFSSFFRRLLSMSVDESLSPLLQTHVTGFFIAAFQSLEVGIVRKECASLVSISIWHHLHNDQARAARLADHNLMKKAWRAYGRRFEAADESTKGKLVFERSWLYTKIVDFLDRIYDESLDRNGVIYCERFIELLTDLESQLPTRRYVNSLVQDLNLLPLIRQSPAFRDVDNGLFRDLYDLLRHFVQFPVDDESGDQYSAEKSQQIYAASLARLQRTALKAYKEKLSLLALSNYGTLGQRVDLDNHFKSLSDSELADLATLLGLRTTYSDCKRLRVDRALLQEVLISAYERQPSFQDRVEAMNITPTEVDLYDPSLLRNETYDGSRSLAVPKLNLQYLTLGDFLWRSFILHRCETFYEIRHDMEDVVTRLQSRSDSNGGALRFAGSSKMAIPISQPAILEVAHPKVGEKIPSYVRAEVTLNVAKLGSHNVADWDALKPGDVVYLLTIKPKDEHSVHTNGHSESTALEQTDLKYLRTAEVVQVQDEGGQRIREQRSRFEDDDEFKRRPKIRRLIVNIDAAAFAEDQARKAEGKLDIYAEINVVVRRKGRENNFKPVLESIKKLTVSQLPVPTWLQEVFLGFGDPTSASYKTLDNKLASLDLRDTFLDWQHLTEALPGKTVQAEPADSAGHLPPYVLQTSATETHTPSERPVKKRRRDEHGSSVSITETVKVSTYSPPNNGPYAAAVPKQNTVRFTPAQTAAIISGTQPGLTVIVGPPGTGKTDVATQIINNLYHNFSEQRTLLVAHSNQALNQLFQKITRLDIDGRHLLRLGHGEEDLETEASYGKQGRVESFLDNRFSLLSEVSRLASNLGAPGAHGESCETAGYFKSVYVDPAWAKFWSALLGAQEPGKVAREVFPFYHFFSNAPQPLFPEGASDEVVFTVAKGCERHIAKIFTELEDIRPFELLRAPRDKANYLLIKEARIIAMTSTHAAMRRQEIADLGFHFDNLIMEEAAQITEIENFIPLALQNPRDGKLSLKRVVLCGDHYQNSPIIQNVAFRQFANLEQSMFLRFVRLGVPCINLDKQGRARSSIADLYRWRYKDLGDLPNVLTGLEYRRANAGFRYDWQFIDVPDYKGQGETQPTPHFIQNLGEAEYAVAIYQYMRLLGHPAHKISILTTYAGQSSLIRDVLQHRCARNRLFGLPRHVTTVDKYQGEQNDFVILSLVRTDRVGYLRDIRRLTVALSRARLGLYVLGRQTVFESCFELREAFSRLFQRPTTLQLVPGELAPTKREVDAKADATEMTGVEHLGQYVYDITQAKIKQMNGIVPIIGKGDNGTEAEPVLEEMEGDQDAQLDPDDQDE